MNGKIFQPEKYGMDICAWCNAQGYVLNPKRQCCPKCGGFGYVKKEIEETGKYSPTMINSGRN